MEIPSFARSPEAAVRLSERILRAGAREDAYLVLSGDNLAKIAQRHQTTVKALNDANPANWSISGDNDGNDHALFGTPFTAQWIHPVAGNSQQIATALSGFCLEVTQGQDVAHTWVRTRRCNGVKRSTSFVLVRSSP